MTAEDELVPSWRLEPALIEFDPRSRRLANPWDSDSHNPLWLLTPEELALVPDGAQLCCIDKTVAVKGRDEIDTDTRFGYTAFGFLETQLPASPVDWRSMLKPD